MPAGVPQARSPTPGSVRRTSPKFNVVGSRFFLKGQGEEIRGIQDLGCADVGSSLEGLEGEQRLARLVHRSWLCWQQLQRSLSPLENLHLRRTTRKAHACNCTLRASLRTSTTAQANRAGSLESDTAGDNWTMNSVFIYVYEIYGQIPSKL